MLLIVGTQMKAAVAAYSRKLSGVPAMKPRSHVGDGMRHHQAIRHVAEGLGLSEAVVTYALGAATGSVAEPPEESVFGQD